MGSHSQRRGKRRNEEVIHFIIKGVEASLFTGGIPLLSANQQQRNTGEKMPTTNSVNTLKVRKGVRLSKKIALSAAKDFAGDFN